MVPFQHGRIMNMPKMHDPKKYGNYYVEFTTKEKTMMMLEFLETHHPEMFRADQPYKIRLHNSDCLEFVPKTN